jgi:hypothetical protein
MCGAEPIDRSRHIYDNFLGIALIPNENNMSVAPGLGVAVHEAARYVGDV